MRMVGITIGATSLSVEKSEEVGVNDDSHVKWWQRSQLEGEAIERDSFAGADTE
ncbi:hypothetical protein Vi05172_g354 [Venturia inaequalis]|nr:hypothetical protein Vi05172_g354 [Venturia inaequalis]